MYPVHTFFIKYILKNKHFLIGLNLVHTGTYSRKKVCTEYILREKSMYRVQTGLCPFISVPYYSMVHTGMYRYELGSYNGSRFQMGRSSGGAGRSSGSARFGGGGAGGRRDRRRPNRLSL